MIIHIAFLQRCSVEPLFPHVFLVRRPPGGRISRFTHIWGMRALHTHKPSKWLCVCDSAGPHAGGSVETAVEAQNGDACTHAHINEMIFLVFVVQFFMRNAHVGVPVTGPMGGWTTTSQLADDERVCVLCDTCC